MVSQRTSEILSVKDKVLEQVKTEGISRIRFTTRISMKTEHRSGIRVVLGATPMAIEKSCLRKPRRLETINLNRPSLR